MDVPKSSTRSHTIQQAHAIYMKRKHLKKRHSLSRFLCLGRRGSGVQIAPPRPKRFIILEGLIVFLTTFFLLPTLDCAKTVPKPLQFGRAVSDPSRFQLAFRLSLPSASLFHLQFHLRVLFEDLRTDIRPLTRELMRRVEEDISPRSNGWRGTL